MSDSALESQLLLLIAVDAGCCSYSEKNTSDRPICVTHESPKLPSVYDDYLDWSHAIPNFESPSLCRCFLHTGILVPKARILNRLLRKTWSRSLGETVVIQRKEKMILTFTLGQKNIEVICRTCANRPWQAPILQECFPWLKPETNLTEWAQEGKEKLRPPPQASNFMVHERNAPRTPPDRRVPNTLSHSMISSFSGLSYLPQHHLNSVVQVYCMRDIS